MKRLPIGIQTFKKLREKNCLYVDKTKSVHAVMDDGGCFFLARPRRFGKSLFLSTLQELAEGNRALFCDTWIDDKWNWTRKYPVIHLEFAAMSYKELGGTVKYPFTIRLVYSIFLKNIVLTTIGLSRGHLLF
jgi:hypothetical protein